MILLVDVFLLCDISRMKSYEITFVQGVSAFQGARDCSLLRFSELAASVLLVCRARPEVCLILGDVRAAFPDRCTCPSVEECRTLGLTAEGQDDDVLVLCRMIIPADDPLSAGFDMSRLVLAAPSTGLGLEVERPGFPLIPLAVSDRERRAKKHHGERDICATDRMVSEKR